MTSWHGNTVNLIGTLWGNPVVTGGFPSRRTSNVKLWCFLSCEPEKLFNHDSSRWWFERPSCSSEVTVMNIVTHCNRLTSCCHYPRQYWPRSPGSGSTLLRVMTCYHQAIIWTSVDLSSKVFFGTLLRPLLKLLPHPSGGQWVNSSSCEQNGHHFTDDIFKCIFLNENVWISLKISLKFVPKVRINNITALAQIMAWCWPDTSHHLNQWWLVCWRIYASLGLNELKASLKGSTTMRWRWITTGFKYLLPSSGKLP